MLRDTSVGTYPTRHKKNQWENTMKRFAFSLLLVALIPSMASADAALGVKVGTLGLGIEGSFDLTPKWGIRGSLNQYDYSYEDDLDGVEYDGDLELSSAALLADFRPFESGFRLSGGAVFNDNTIRGVALPDAVYEIGDTFYTLEETGTLTAIADFDSVAPYVGLGYDFGRQSNFRVNLELGVLFQGEAAVRFDSTGGTLSNDPTLRAELDREAEISQDDLEDYDIYPVLSIGFSYAFK